MKALEFQNLTVVVEDRTVLKDLSLVVPRGEIHALMGPNGTGKSSLAKAVAGHPSYEIAKGDALLDGKSIVGTEPDEIAQLGLFLAFQYPSEIPGVSIANFIRAALVARLEKGEELNATQLYRTLYEKMDLLQIDRKFTARSVNEGFSGGEKKRSEILQLLMLKPTYAIMDETDSGLDIDALKVVANGVNLIRGDDIGILIITHYQRLLNYIVPDRVHVLWDGRIVRSGGKELALELEEKGYDWVKEELAVSA